MPNKLMQWNDGEGVEYLDLMKMQYLRDVRAWEDELYGRFVEIIAGSQNPGSFTSSFDAGLGDNLWFVRNKAWMVGLSGLNVSTGYGQAARIASGMQATRPDTKTNDYDRLIEQVWRESHVAATLSANSSGNPRYDLIAVDTAETAGDSETRDFKDATTLALSTQAMNKRLTLGVSYTVTEGTPAASPTIPSLPVGSTCRWAAVLVPNGGNPTHEDEAAGLPGVIDYSYPYEMGLFTGAVPGRLGFGDSSWIPTPGHSNLPTGFFVDSAVSGESIIYLPPDPFKGDACARLIGLSILHAIDDDSPTIEIGRIQLGGGADGFTALYALGSLGTTDGQARITNYDMTGSGTDPGEPPVWCNGYPGGRCYEAEEAWSFGGVHNSLALKITKGANTDSADIHSIVWRIAR